MASIRERLTGTGREKQLREDLQTALAQVGLVEENMRELELAISGDAEWRRLGLEIDREFTRTGLDDIVKLSRAMYLSHPLIQRAVNVRAYYVWAQGWSYQAHDDRVQAEVVDPMTSDEYNRSEYYGHQSRILTDLDQMCDGNIFLPLFTNDNGDVSVRSIPVEEIREIHTSPKDNQRVRYYRRYWSQQEFDESTGRVNVQTYEKLYPDARYYPNNRPESIGGIDVLWHAPILHQRTGGLKQMRFGIPETYAALDWARAYRKFLEDWHTIVASLAKFAWRATTTGKSKSEKVKRKLGSTMTPEEPVERQRAPIPGSVWMGGPDDSITPINKSGAHTSSEDAKPSRLMVASAMDLPDTILSNDPQQGALATAQTLDRPTELAMLSRQQMWRELDQRIFRYRIDAMVRRSKLPGRIEPDVDGTFVEPTLDAAVDVKFPPILEHDIGEMVSAIVTAATLDGKVEAGTVPRDRLASLLMTTVGVEDVEAALDDLEDQEAEQIAGAVERLAEVIGANGDRR